MSLSLRLCFIIAASVGWIGKCKSDPGLELPTERVTGLGCIPEGRNVSYQCTLLDNGVGSTVWLGSAFTCSSADKITLNHFEYPGAMGICGNFSAMSVNFTAGVEYTSRLTFTATAALNGAVIECTLSTQAFSNDTVKIGALPPPPGPLMVTLSSDSSLTVSWSPPSGPVEGGVGGYVFGVTGEECGCMSMNVSGDTTSVMCSGWTAAGQTCSFEVRTLSQDCGFTSEPVTKSVLLSIPLWIPAPIIIAVVTVCGAVAVIVVVFCYHKHKTKVPKDLHQSEPVYEDPDDLKPDPHTEGNLAYGHVEHTGRQQSSQPPTELRGQVYEEPENFKPDPHTQGNVAYGQVQF